MYLENMRKFVTGFLIFVALYHVIVTFVSFGQLWLPPYGVLIVRDGWWLLAICLMALYHRKWIVKHLQQRWYVWLAALGVLVVALFTSLMLNVDIKHIVVGIKYTLYYIVPFLTALYLGSLWSNVYDKKQFSQWVLWMWRVLVWVLILWWLWQIGKNLLPDFFAWLGYGPLGDYVFGAKPPLYYLTWPRGVQRRSWLFSWPNNYWYLLVVFFWLYWYGIRNYIKQNWAKLLLWSLYIVTLIATLSRGAIMWVLVQVVLISYVIYQAQRRIIFFAIGAWLALVGALSALKWQSTVAHIHAKMQSLVYVQQAPRWYGLWSSGPSIHNQWWYLPENFFIQLMMDLGVHGFIIWAIFWLMVLEAIRRIYVTKPHARSLVFFLTVWFAWIMVEWLFLHVLEDSMVNYMYFIMWWIVVWYVGSERESLKV